MPDDKDVHQLNQIRSSLALISDNSTAFGLTQVSGCYGALKLLK